MGKYYDLAYRLARENFESNEAEVIRYKEGFLESLAEFLGKYGRRKIDAGQSVASKKGTGVDWFRADLRILRKWIKEEGFSVNSCCVGVWHEGEPDYLDVWILS